MGDSKIQSISITVSGANRAEMKNIKVEEFKEL